MFSGEAARAQETFQRMNREREAAKEKAERQGVRVEEGRGERMRPSVPRDGLGPRDVQFPIGKLRSLPLEDRLEWMRNCDVLQWGVDQGDAADQFEILLEVWARSRYSHDRLMDLGELYQVKITWGMATLRINIVGMKDDIPVSKMPSILDCGLGNAFVISLRDFQTYRMFGRGRRVEGPAMGARLIYLAAMDMETHHAPTLGDFEQWPEDLVMALLDEHNLGDSFRRPSTEEAGLITIKRTGRDNEVFEELPMARPDLDWLDGNDTASSTSTEWTGEDIGQSPELNESSSRHPALSPARDPENGNGKGGSHYGACCHKEAEPQKKEVDKIIWQARNNDLVNGPELEGWVPDDAGGRRRLVLIPTALMTTRRRRCHPGRNSREQG